METFTEDSLVKLKVTELKEEIKKLYNVSKLCKSEVRLFYNSDDGTVFLYSNNIEHDHSKCNDCDWGIPNLTKQRIEQLYVSGVTKPKLIQYALLQEKIEEPSNAQLSNIKKILKNFKKKSIGKTNITFNLNNNFFTYNFDEAANIMSHVYWVVINMENWEFSTCTCSIYQKNYFCSHLTSIAVSLNLTKIPPK